MSTTALALRQESRSQWARRRAKGGRLSPYKDPADKRRADREGARRRRDRGREPPPFVSIEWEWRNQAACKGHPTEWWYETAGPGRQSATNRRKSYPNARPICDGCPVKSECLKDAEQYEELADLRWRQGSQIHGMRGGLTPLERWKLRTSSTKYRKFRNDYWAGKHRIVEPPRREPVEPPKPKPVRVPRPVLRSKKWHEHQAAIEKEQARWVNKRHRREARENTAS